MDPSNPSTHRLGGGRGGGIGDANVKSEWHHMLLHNAPPCGVICSPTLHTFISPPTYSGRVQTHYQCLECVINVQYGGDRLLTLPLKLRTCVMALLFPSNTITEVGDLGLVSM
jgi:hypothetical protein